ncbi:MAG: hypothetical protein R2755_14265 [Acidimicrobiales bacterium]
MAAAAALVGAPLAVVGPARAALADPAADQDALVDADVAPAIAQADHQSAQLVFAHRDAGGAVTISTATVDSAAEGHAVLAVAGASGTLEAVSVDSPVTLVPDAPIEPDPGPGGPGGDVSADAVSNDFYRSLQWALDTIPFEDAADRRRQRCHRGRARHRRGHRPPRSGGQPVAAAPALPA